MIYEKENPIGIDKALGRFQKKLEAIGIPDVHIYGRIYLNKKGDDILPQVHVKGKDYESVFINDKHTGDIGFLIDGTRTGFDMINTKVKMICSFNLDRVYDTTKRNDEELLLQVVDSISKLAKAPDWGEINTDFDEVYREVTRSKFKARQMQPWFNFSVEFTLRYVNDICDYIAIDNN